MYVLFAEGRRTGGNAGGRVGFEDLAICGINLTKERKPNLALGIRDKGPESRRSSRGRGVGLNAGKQEQGLPLKKVQRASRGRPIRSTECAYHAR